MRIAYLSQTFPSTISGASLVASGLARGMAKRGHQVLVLTVSDQDQPYSESCAGLTIHRYRSVKNPLRKGHRFGLFPYLQIQRDLKAFQPDIIHTHDPFQFGLSAVDYSSKKQVPALLTIHQLPWFVDAYLPPDDSIKKYIHALLWRYSSWLARHFDGLIAPSKTVASIIQQQAGLNPLVIGYGYDPSLFHNNPLQPAMEAQLRTEFGLPPQVPIILHVGRLDPEKNTAAVIRAAAQAMQRNSAHLLIVGDGTGKASLMELCQQLGIAPRCHFSGFVQPGNSLPEIYRLASVFINASEIETQGLTLLEAAASGLPIVAVRSPCVEEIVQHGVSGWLSAAGDLPGLAGHLQAVLSDKKAASFMGRAARQRSLSHTLEQTFTSHENLYRQFQFSRAATTPTTLPLLLAFFPLLCNAPALL